MCWLNGARPGSARAQAMPLVSHRGAARPFLSVYGRGREACNTDAPCAQWLTLGALRVRVQSRDIEVDVDQAERRPSSISARNACTVRCWGWGWWAWLPSPCALTGEYCMGAACCVCQ
eukprot:423327-Prymnesium_polylepis.2